MEVTLEESNRVIVDGDHISWNYGNSSDVGVDVDDDVNGAADRYHNPTKMMGKSDATSTSTTTTKKADHLRRLVVIRNSSSLVGTDASTSIESLREYIVDTADDGSGGLVSYTGDCNLDDDDDDDDDDYYCLGEYGVKGRRSASNKRRQLFYGNGRSKRTAVLCLALAFVVLVAFIATIAGVLSSDKKNQNRNTISEAAIGSFPSLEAACAYSKSSSSAGAQPPIDSIVPKVPKLELYFQAWTIGSQIGVESGTGTNNTRHPAQHRLANETEILILERAIQDSFNRLTENGCADLEYGRWMINVTMTNQTLDQTLEFLDEGSTNLAVDFIFESTLLTVFETQISCVGCDEPTAFATVYPDSFSTTSNYYSDGLLEPSDDPTTEGGNATEEGGGNVRRRSLWSRLFDTTHISNEDLNERQQAGGSRRSAKRSKRAGTDASSPSHSSYNNIRRGLQQEGSSLLSAGIILTEISRTISKSLSVDEFGQISEATITTPPSEDGTIPSATVRIKGSK